MELLALQRARRLPPHLFFVASAVFHYLGPPFAVLLFARLSVPGVVLLRISSAAAVFAIWKRRLALLSKLDRESARLLFAFAAVLAAMNTVFYYAIVALPLVAVGAIEFLGPITLAAIGVRSLRNVAALVLAISGVALLTKALLLATATVIGIIILRQVPSEREIIAVALVIAGIAAHQPPDSQEPEKRL